MKAVNPTTPTPPLDPCIVSRCCRWRDAAALPGSKRFCVAPEATPPPAAESVQAAVAECAGRIVQARARGAAVMLIYGAHLLRNGAAFILERMMARGWITHLATNGAGTIHDWEYAWLGRSTESVGENVATGTFGTWDETGREHPPRAPGRRPATARATAGRSAGSSREDGATLPPPDELEARSAPSRRIR